MKSFSYTLTYIIQFVCNVSRKKRAQKSYLIKSPIKIKSWRNKPYTKLHFLHDFYTFFCRLLIMSYCLSHLLLPNYLRYNRNSSNRKFSQNTNNIYSKKFILRLLDFLNRPPSSTQHSLLFTFRPIRI